jgi:hypothetical protein
MRTLDLHAPTFGSSHDPVLHGVAAGLADLFPPVDHPTRQMDEPDLPSDFALASEGPADPEM